MPQASALLTDLRKIFGDTGADFIDDTTGLTWLDTAQQDFCADVWSLEEIKDYAIATYDAHFILPTDCILPMSAMWYKSKTIKLAPEVPNVWDQLMEAYPRSDGTPYHYTILRRGQDAQELRVGPQRPNARSATTTLGLGNSITAIATTIAMAYATGTFRPRGWVIIESEIVEFGAISGSSLIGCLRGMHGTTGAAHGGGCGVNITLTEVDLAVRYKRMPAALTSSTSPEIPEVWHRYLETYALYLAYLAHGEEKKANTMLEVYLKQKETARKSIGRRHQDGLQKIQPRRMGSLYPPV